MDRIEFLMGAKVGLLLVALAASACLGSGARQEPTPDPGVVSVVPVALAATIAALSQSDAAVIRSFDLGVPESIPETAVAFTAFIAGQYEVPRRESRDLILASVRATSVVMEVVCVDPVRQVGCTHAATSWRVRFDDRQGVVVDTSGTMDAPVAGILLTLSGDEGRAQVASRGFWASPPVGVAARSADEFVHEAVFAGCDFALLVDSLAPSNTFTPLTSASPSSPIYLVIRTCSDRPTRAVVPYLVVDGTRTAHLGTDGDPIGAIEVEPDVTYAIPVSLAPVGTGHTVQAFVLPIDDWEAWVSWPVSITE